MSESPASRRTAWLSLPLALAVLLLAGCASTLSARVTTFSRWPADIQGQAYRFAPPEKAPPGGDLEYQAYQDMVRAAMGATGLVEAPAGAPDARFTVQFRYESKPTQVIVQEPYDPYFYGMPGFYGYHRWAWGGFYGGPAWVPVQMTAYRKSLTVEIRDGQRGGEQVYRSTATTMGESEEMARVMPYLTRAIFDGFPGNNGQVREVKYTRD